MEDTLNNAYAEVGAILDFLGDSYKQKIPEKVIKLFDVPQKKHYKITSEKNKFSRKALIIISILNLKYWEQDCNKKEQLKNIYDKNEIEYQEKINAYKREDWLKDRNKSFENKKANAEVSLIIQENIPILEKIKRFFRKLVHRK